MVEEAAWWVWSGATGGAWAAVVVVVVAVGGVANVAVVVHWVTTRTAHDSLAAALPLADLLVCLLAAPLRYAQAPSVMGPEEQSVDHNVTWRRTETASNTSDVVDLGHYGGCEAGRVVVVGLCVWSLHVVVVVALHRVALLLRLSPTLPPHQFTAVLVAGMALLASSALVGGLHVAGCFTESLPLLGQCRPLQSQGATPPLKVMVFLCYLAILCGLTTLCYLVIMAALLHQGCTKTPSVPQPGYISSATPQPRVQGEGGTGYGGQERTLRACVTVLVVLVTLVVCWMLPITLALYALLAQPSLTPTLPYSDALILLSALVHPFVYREGWVALIACYDGLCYTLVSTAKLLGLSCKSKIQILPMGVVEERSDPAAGTSNDPSTSSNFRSSHFSH